MSEQLPYGTLAPWFDSCPGARAVYYGDDLETQQRRIDQFKQAHPDRAWALAEIEFVSPRLMEQVPDGRMSDQAFLEECRSVVELASSIFDKRTQTIVWLLLGIGDEGPLTLKEIGRRVGLTRERVRQIFNEAVYLLRLRHDSQVRLD